MPLRDRDHAALAAALDPIVTIDHVGTIQSASNSIARVLGWTPDELIGENVNVLMPEPHRSAHDGYLRRYLETGVTSILNRPRRLDAAHKDGTLVPIELSVSRADVPGQSMPLFVGIIRALAERAPDDDNSEESRLYRLLAEQTSALQMAHHRLRMADRMASIGALAAGLGHDMNNVLLPVRARLNALRASMLAAPAPEHVEGIIKSVAYLQQLADGLHFLAMDPDSESLESEETDIHSWWEQAGALLSKAVPKHVTVEALIPDDLPPVTVAAHALTQAVLNLVVNAGEAIPRESERPGRVTIAARLIDDDNVEVAVSDNGVGMSPETQRRALELFFTTKTRGLGTGLGLALVHKVADRAGGSIDIDSREGSGTTVRLRFPVVIRARDDAKQQIAVITMRDGRAAAMVRNVLELSGASASMSDDPGDADIWVADPNVAALDAARAWSASRRGLRLVIIGKPQTAVSEWAALKPINIEAPNDLNAVRTALGAALER